MPRLGLVLDQILFRHDGRWSTDEVFIRFIERLARTRFDRVLFYSRTRDETTSAPYELDTGLFEIVPLPWYRDVPDLCLRSPVLLPRSTAVLSRAMAELDLLVASGIHPLSSLALRMAKRRGLPAVLWIRGNLFADLDHRTSGARRWAARAAAWTCLRSIPAGTPVVCMGRDDFPFLQRMGPVQVAYSSKFAEDDVRKDLPAWLASPTRARLLYVGRLAPEKGLDVLFESLRRLRRRFDPAPTLTIVGADFYGSAFGSSLQRAAEASDLGPFIRFLGHVPFGPKLLGIYDEHDILVLPSYTEGFPQVLLEAMARGVPVVATRVGGVPRLVRDGENGLLVSPGDPAALAGALERLMTSPSLASELRRHGLDTARAFMLETQLAAVGSFLDRCFPNAGFAGLHART